MSRLRRALLSGSEVTVGRDDFFWSDVSDVGHLSEELFQECELILKTHDEFVAGQAVLENIHICLKSKSHRKGFLDKFRWQDTDYTEARLVERGFNLLSRSAITAVADANQRYEIKFFYLVEQPKLLDPMVSLCEEAFVSGTTRYPNLAGQSVVKERGNKTMAGEMLAFGSWDAYGNAAQKLGKGVKQVRVYGPNSATSKTFHDLMRAHVDDLTSREADLTPACAASRSKIADRLDPEQCHRMSEKSSAFSMTVSTSYIADPHNDSGESGALEFIKFVNVNGPLPQHHRWLFTIAGCILELPNEPLATVIVGLPGQGVFHGTLPTSSTEETYRHGNFGSALITKRSICEGLERQQKSGKQTPHQYCSSSLYFGLRSKDSTGYLEVAHQLPGEVADLGVSDTVTDVRATSEPLPGGISTTSSSTNTAAPPAPTESSPTTTAAPIENDTDQPQKKQKTVALNEGPPTIGDGGCVAHVMAALHVFPSAEEAMQKLNEQITIVKPKFCAQQQVPEFIGIPNDRWHPEVVKAAVVKLKENYHLRKLDLAKVDLREEVKWGSLMFDGVLNDTYVRRRVIGDNQLDPEWVVNGASLSKGYIRLCTDPDDKTTAASNVAGWRHAIAVRSGWILDREIEMSADYLWLEGGNRPDVERGYFRKIYKVYRIFKCATGKVDCKGECAGFPKKNPKTTAPH